MSADRCNARLWVEKEAGPRTCELELGHREWNGDASPHLSHQKPGQAWYDDSPCAVATRDVQQRRHAPGERADEEGQP